MPELRCTVHLSESTQLTPTACAGEGARVVAWLDVGPGLSLYGGAADMRRLAAVALEAAEDADRVALARPARVIDGAGHPDRRNGGGR